MSGKSTPASLRVRALLAQHPDMEPPELARRAGVSVSAARAVRRRFLKAQGRLPVACAGKKALYDALLANPDEPAESIARRLGYHVHNVRQARAKLAEAGFSPPCEPPPPPPPVAPPTAGPRRLHAASLRALRAIACATEAELALIRRLNPQLIEEAKAMGVLP